MHVFRVFTLLLGVTFLASSCATVAPEIQERAGIARLHLIFDS